MLDTIGIGQEDRLPPDDADTALTQVERAGQTETPRLDDALGFGALHRVAARETDHRFVALERHHLRNCPARRQLQGRDATVTWIISSARVSEIVDLPRPWRTSVASA